MILNFIREQKRLILLIIYLLSSLFMMIISSQKATAGIRTFFTDAVFQINSIVEDATEFTGDLWNSIRKMKDLKKELQTANEKIRLLEDSSQEAEDLRKQNIRLKEILGYKEKISYPTIPAEIIGKDPKYYYDVIIVDKGRADGVMPHMPVIGYQNGQSGIVGKTVETGLTASKILLLTDTSSYISAMIQKSGHTGLVRGRGTLERFMNFLYVDRNARALYGDLVVTSGQGGIFPKGITIGPIVSVNDARFGIYYSEIRVKPLIDLSKLDMVFIILKKESDELRQLLRNTP